MDHLRSDIYIILKKKKSFRISEGTQCAHYKYQSMDVTLAINGITLRAIDRQDIWTKYSLLILQQVAKSPTEVTRR
jgi:hypothetical protein